MNSVRRIHVRCPNIANSALVPLSDEDLHHLTRVLRLGSGDKLLVIEGSLGLSAEAHLEEHEGRLAARICSPPTPTNQTSKVGHLIFALAKGDKNDLVLEKACELGARSIILWQAERSVVKIEAKNIDAKLSRWQKICKAAAEQCGNPHIPRVSFATHQQELIDELSKDLSPNDLKLICSLHKNSKPLREITSPKGLVHLAVGPEGDFAPHEEELFISSGFLPISLGPRVLRCETAAIVALAAVQSHWEV